MDKEHQSRQARLQEIQAKKEKLAELRRNRQLLKDQEHKTRLSIGGGANVGPLISYRNDLTASSSPSRRQIA
jgi:hypothetical protein